MTVYCLSEYIPSFQQTGNVQVGDVIYGEIRGQDYHPYNPNELAVFFTLADTTGNIKITLDGISGDMGRMGEIELFDANGQIIDSIGSFDGQKQISKNLSDVITPITIVVTTVYRHYTGKFRLVISTQNEIIPPLLDYTRLQNPMGEGFGMYSLYSGENENSLLKKAQFDIVPTFLGNEFPSNCNLKIESFFIAEKDSVCLIAACAKLNVRRINEMTERSVNVKSLVSLFSSTGNNIQNTSLFELESSIFRVTEYNTTFNTIFSVTSNQYFTTQTVIGLHSDSEKFYLICLKYKLVNLKEIEGRQISPTFNSNGEILIYQSTTGESWTQAPSSGAVNVDIKPSENFQVSSHTVGSTIIVFKLKSNIIRVSTDAGITFYPLQIGFFNNITWYNTGSGRVLCAVRLDDDGCYGKIICNQLGVMQSQPWKKSTRAWGHHLDRFDALYTKNQTPPESIVVNKSQLGMLNYAQVNDFNNPGNLRQILPTDLEVTTSGAQVPIKLYFDEGPGGMQIFRLNRVRVSNKWYQLIRLTGSKLGWGQITPQFATGADLNTIEYEFVQGVL